MHRRIYPIVLAGVVLLSIMAAAYPFKKAYAQKCYDQQGQTIPCPTEKEKKKKPTETPVPPTALEPSPYPYTGPAPYPYPGGGGGGGGPVIALPWWWILLILIPIGLLLGLFVPPLFRPPRPGPGPDPDPMATMTVRGPRGDGEGELLPAVNKQDGSNRLFKPQDTEMHPPNPNDAAGRFDKPFDTPEDTEM